MKAVRGIGLAALTLGIVIGLGCGHQSSVPVVAAGALTPPNASGLPFDRAAQTGGISPTNSVIPPGAQLPAGTPIVVRLRKPLSSAKVHPNETFSAVLEEPVVINDHVVAEQGVTVTGRIVEAKSTRQANTPGYLRLTLSSILIDGKPARIRTSSSFFKGISPRRRVASLPTDSEGILIGASTTSKVSALGDATDEEDEQEPLSDVSLREAMVSPERRLSFRLIEPLPIHP
jgi:hypothetical protein